MENSLAVFAVSLFIFAVLSTGVSGKAFDDGNQEPLKADTIQLAGSTNEPCVYKEKFLRVDLRSVAAKFK